MAIHVRARDGRVATRSESIGPRCSSLFRPVNFHRHILHHHLVSWNTKAGVCRQSITVSFAVVFWFGGCSVSEHRVDRTIISYTILNSFLYCSSLYVIVKNQEFNKAKTKTGWKIDVIVFLFFIFFIHKQMVFLCFYLWVGTILIWSFLGSGNPFEKELQMCTQGYQFVMYRA